MKCDETYNPCLDTGGGHSTGSLGAYCLYNTQCSVSNGKASCDCSNTKITYESCSYSPTGCPANRYEIREGDRCNSELQETKCCTPPASPSPAPAPAPAQLPWWYWLGGGIPTSARRRLLSQQDISTECIDDYKYYCSNALDKKHCYYKHLIHMPSCPKTVEKKSDMLKTQDLHSKHVKYITRDHEEYEHVGNGTYHLRKPKLKSTHDSDVWNGPTLTYQNQTQSITNVIYWSNGFTEEENALEQRHGQSGQQKYDRINIVNVNPTSSTIITQNKKYLSESSDNLYILPSWQQHNSINDCRNTCLRGSYIRYAANKSPYSFNSVLFPSYVGEREIFLNQWELLNEPTHPGYGPFHNESSCDTEICQNKIVNFTNDMKNPYKWSSSDNNYVNSINIDFVPAAFNGHLLDVQSTDASCEECEGGKYSDTSFETVCKNCPAGTYNIWPDQPKGCADCASGKYQDVEGQTSCKSCAAGRYSIGDSGTLVLNAFKNCLYCMFGAYQDEIGESGCKYCPSGKYASIGSTVCIDERVGYKCEHPSMVDVTNDVGGWGGLTFQSVDNKEKCWKEATYRNNPAKPDTMAVQSICSRTYDDYWGFFYWQCIARPEPILTAYWDGNNNICYLGNVMPSACSGNNKVTGDDKDVLWFPDEYYQAPW